MAITAARTRPTDVLAARRPGALRGLILGAGGLLRHGLMVVGMLPCVFGGTRLQHAYSILLLLILAVWLAVRGRRDSGQLPDLVDAVAMVALLLAASLSGHATATSHMHADAGISLSDLLVIISVTAWIGMRSAVTPRWSGAGSRRLIHLAAATGMIAVMALMVVLH